MLIAPCFIVLKYIYIYIYIYIHIYIYKQVKCLTLTCLWSVYFLGEGAVPRSVPQRRDLPLLAFLNKYAVLFYSRSILLLSLFYTDHLVFIILFNYDCLNSTTILLCLCFAPFISFYTRHWWRNHRFWNIIVINFRRCDIDIACCFTLTSWNGFLIYIYIFCSTRLWFCCFSFILK